MGRYMMVRNSSITEAASDGMSLVKLDDETVRKSDVAEKVFDKLMGDPKLAHHALGGALWHEFQATFYK